MDTEGGLHLSEWGSIPHSSTSFYTFVAQLDRATSYEEEGYRFESYQEYQFYIASIVYRLGHQVFNLTRRVRFSLGVPYLVD